MADLSGAQIRRLSVLHAIWSEAGGKANENVLTQPLKDRLQGDPVLATIDLDAELSMLKQRGLVDFWAGGTGAVSAFLTPEGRNAAEEFDQQRRSLPMRRKQLRDEYLAWLYEQIEGRDRHPTPDDFLATNPTYLGEPFTAVDLEKTGAWLRQHGFIAGQGAWQYDGPLRPTLTAKGSWVMENGRSTNDPPPGATSHFTTVVNGNANVANASTGFSQQLTADGAWLVDARALIESVEQALPALKNGAEVTALVAESRAVVDGKSPKPAKLKKAMGSLADFLGRSGSGALGGVLAKQIGDFLASLT